MLYQGGECKLSDVSSQVEKKETFGWSWSLEKREPYRHTAIVLYFDHEPSFTINFRPGKGANKFDAAFGECSSCVTIERVKKASNRRVKYHEPFEEFSITTREGEKKAMDTVELIMSYKPGDYNLLSNNCRDFVDGVKEHVRDRRKVLHTGNYEQQMAGVRGGDFNRMLGAASGAMAAVGAVLLGATALANYLGREEEENEEIRERRHRQHQ